MITNLGKILAITLAIFSAGFLGVSAAVLTGSYPWSRHTDELDGYVLESEKTAEKTTYTLSRRLPNSSETEPVKSGEVLPDVLIAGHRAELEALKAEETQLDTKLARYLEDASALKQQHEADRQALADYEAALRAELDRIKDVIDDEKQRLEAYQAVTSAVRNEDLERESDLARLEAEHEQISADLVRAENQRERLKESILRLEGQVRLLKRREKFLRQQLPEPSETAAAF